MGLIERIEALAADLDLGGGARAAGSAGQEMPG
jgi:hypothetical protein